MSFVPMICSECDTEETSLQRELDKDCYCGGAFMHPPYQFKEKPAVKSSCSTLASAPGKIACQQCGCRDRKRMGCECSCHE